MTENRITIEDGIKDCVIKLAEGNPGAVRALVELMEASVNIDTANFLGAFGPLIALDSLGIYGSAIWQLYKDQCGQSAENTLAVLRAIQLGHISESTVLDSLRQRSPTFDVAGCLAYVKEYLGDSWVSP